MQVDCIEQKVFNLIWTKENLKSLSFQISFTTVIVSFHIFITLRQQMIDDLLNNISNTELCGSYLTIK